MNRESAVKVWDEYVVARRGMVFEVIRRGMEVEDDTFFDALDKVMRDGGKVENSEGDKKKSADTRKLMDELIGLNKFILRVWIPRQLELYANPNGMDKNAQEEYRKCMIAVGIMNEELMRKRIDDAWWQLKQIGT